MKNTLIFAIQWAKFQCSMTLFLCKFMQNRVICSYSLQRRFHPATRHNIKIVRMIIQNCMQIIYNGMLVYILSKLKELTSASKCVKKVSPTNFILKLEKYQNS